MLTSLAAPNCHRIFGWLARAFVVMAVCWGSVATAEPSEGQTKRFSLPAIDATQALAKFAEQSGKQVIYLRDEVRGVRTNAVNGRFSARVAIERMFAGSALRVFEDSETGAWMVRRESPPPKPAAPPGNSHAAPPRPTADSPKQP